MPTIVNRLRSILANTTPNNGCLLWNGTVWSRGGYPRVGSLRVHRLVWSLFHNREIPPGLYVCHRCDTPRCIEPSHLFLGTPKDNSTDRDSKMRHFHGESVNTAKLSNAQVREIRKLYAQAPRKHGMQSFLGKKYGVSHRMIGLIVSRKNWKHI